MAWGMIRSPYTPFSIYLRGTIGLKYSTLGILNIAGWGFTYKANGLMRKFCPTTAKTDEGTYMMRIAFCVLGLVFRLLGFESFWKVNVWGLGLRIIKNQVKKTLTQIETECRLGLQGL